MASRMFLEDTVISWKNSSDFSLNLSFQEQTSKSSIRFPDKSSAVQIERTKDLGIYPRRPIQHDSIHHVEDEYPEIE